MLISRRNMVQQLLLVPAAILSGCPDTGGGVFLKVIVINNDKKNDYYVCSSYDFALGVNVSAGSQTSGNIGVSAVATQQFAVQVRNRKKATIVASQTFTLNQITQDTGQDRTHSHIYVQIDASTHGFVDVMFQAQPGGG
jgi:hypothetical protein